MTQCVSVYSALYSDFRPYTATFYTAKYTANCSKSLPVGRSAARPEMSEHHRHLPRQARAVLVARTLAAFDEHGWDSLPRSKTSPKKAIFRLYTATFYTAKYTAKNRCIALYTDTHCVTALQSYTAIQRDTTLYSIQLYSAIHYTTSTTPLCARRAHHRPHDLNRLPLSVSRPVRARGPLCTNRLHARASARGNQGQAPS